MSTQKPYRDPAQAARDALSKLVLAAFIGISAFFLVTEHRAHALGWLPHVLLAVCVLLLYVNGRLQERAAAGGQDGHG